MKNVKTFEGWKQAVAGALLFFCSCNYVSIRDKNNNPIPTSKFAGDTLLGIIYDIKPSMQGKEIDAIEISDTVGNINYKIRKR